MSSTGDLFAVELDLPGYPCAFSPDRRYRYTLWRAWQRTIIGDPRWRYLMVIGLNPSTADETKDDPTIRRCIRYAQAWDFDALCMTNVFAFRATDPAVMKAQEEPIGWDNMDWLLRIARGAGMVLAAWGVHGSHLGYAKTVRELLDQEGIQLHALGFTKDGHPRHPLYMPKSAKPQSYPIEALP